MEVVQTSSKDIENRPVIIKSMTTQTSQDDPFRQSDLILTGFCFVNGISCCKLAKKCPALYVTGKSLSKKNRKDPKTVRTKERIFARFKDSVNHEGWTGLRLTFNTRPGLLVPHHVPGPVPSRQTQVS